MKLLSKAAALALFGLISAGPAIAAPAEAPVAVEVHGLAPEVARAIKRQASQGKTALIKYLERGRFIYEVRVDRPVVVSKGR